MTTLSDSPHSLRSAEPRDADASRPNLRSRRKSARPEGQAHPPTSKTRASRRRSASAGRGGLDRALLRWIAETVADPQASPEKLDRLIDLHERARARGAQSAFARALAALQPELPVIDERGEIADDDGRVQWRYALWEDINEAIRPLLAKHGFSLSFRTCSEGARVAVTGVLLHTGGHAEETSLSLPLDLSGCKNPVQAVGSSTSYGKRYVAQALLNVTSRGTDDDAQAAVSCPTIDPAQADELRRQVAAVGADESRLAAYLGIASLADLAADQHALARDVLASFGRRRPT